MDHFSNADITVQAARSVLIQEGEHEAADRLRGVEVFNRGDVLLALSILATVEPKSQGSRDACESAEIALHSALRGILRRPSAPPAAA